MRPDRLICCDCVDGMRALPPASVPLTVTSPPYDRIRVYGGHLWDFEKFMLVAGELRRVTMPGGVVIWVVQDQWVDGGLSGTSFRQAIYFKSLGFNLDTVLTLATRGWRHPQARRYPQQTHYGFVLTKGSPRTFNPLRDRPNSTVGQRIRHSKRRLDGGLDCVATERRVGPIGGRGNLWWVETGGAKTTRDVFGSDHPALMPEALARDLIVSWSRPGDLVLDPFGGAATTAKMALLSDRRYLSMEAHTPYHDLARRRMADAHLAYRRQLDHELQLSPSMSSAGGE